MKKIRNLVLLLVATLLLSGCVKYNVNMDIKKDKSMDFELIYAVDPSLLGEDDNVFSKEDLKKLKDAGFEAKEYNEDNLKGFRVTRHIKNIDTISSKEATEYSLSGIVDNGDAKVFKVKKGLFKNRYTADLKFNSSDSNLQEDSPETENREITADTDSEVEYKEADDETTAEDTTAEEATDDNMSLDDYTANMDLSVNVKLPYASISNNATSEKNKGRELKWNLISDDNSDQSIKFEFELYNMTNIYICVGLGIALVICLVIVIVLAVTKKKKAPTPAPTTEQQPTTPENPEEQKTE